jgi:hypothetical protein
MMSLHKETFEYLMPSRDQIGTMQKLRDAAKQYAEVLDEVLADGADKTYTLRKLREVAMWANVAVTRHQDGTPRTDGYPSAK